MNANTVRGILLAILIGAVMVAGVIIASPKAHATPEQDYIYYALLEGNGFRISDPQVMKRNAQIVCADLYSGTNWRVVMARIMSEANHTVDESATIVAAAVIAYCPEMTPPEFLDSQVA